MSTVDPRVWRIGTVTVLGTVMSVLDTTIVNVALEPLGVALHTTRGSIAWVVTAYLLAIAAVSPIAGWAGRRWGTRTVYLWSLVLFTLGSLACGLAWDVTSLVVARVLQGAGGALLMPVGQSIIVTAAGRENLGKVMGTLGVPTVLAPVVGPTLGGWLLETFSWRAIFLINLPIGVLALVLALRMLPKDEGQPTYALDVLGLVLGSVGLATLTYGLSQPAGSNPTIVRPGVIVPVLVGAAVLTAFVRHALHREHPLLDLRLFTDRTYSLSSVSVLINGATSLGGLILLPFYLQNVRHESATTTGLLVAPTAIGVVLLMRRSGTLTDRFGGGRIATIGTMIVAVSTLPLAWIADDSSYVFICTAMFFRGIGTALCGMPLMAAALRTISPLKNGDATTQLFVLQRVGGALGTALFVVVLTRSGSFGTSYAVRRRPHRPVGAADPRADREREAHQEPHRPDAARRADRLKRNPCGTRTRSASSPAPRAARAGPRRSASRRRAPTSRSSTSARTSRRPATRARPSRTWPRPSRSSRRRAGAACPSSRTPVTWLPCRRPPTASCPSSAGSTSSSPTPASAPAAASSTSRRSSGRRRCRSTRPAPSTPSRPPCPVLIEQGRGGAIVVVSSVAGLRGLPFLSDYSASKHAITGLAKSVANEVAQHRIRVNTIHPASVPTGMTTPELFPLVSRTPRTRSGRSS